jgi:hypothetical protein
MPPTKAESPEWYPLIPRGTSSDWNQPFIRNFLDRVSLRPDHGGPTTTRSPGYAQRAGWGSVVEATTVLRTTTLPRTCRRRTGRAEARPVPLVRPGPGNRSPLDYSAEPGVASFTRGVGKVGQAQGPLCDPTYPTQTALSVNSALTPAMRANATKSRPKPGPRLRGSSEGPATGTPASTSLAAGRPTRWRRALRCGAPTYGVTRRSETTARRIRRELVANASTS